MRLPRGGGPLHPVGEPSVGQGGQSLERERPPGAVERRAEALDEGHGAGEWAGHPAPPRRPALEGEERPDEEAQHQGEEPGIPGQTEAHRHGQRERPLPVRSPGEDALHEVDGGVVRPASVAGRTHPARLAREGDQHLGVAGLEGAPEELGPADGAARADGLGGAGQETPAGLTARSELRAGRRAG